MLIFQIIYQRNSVLSAAKIKVIIHERMCVSHNGIASNLHASGNMCCIEYFHVASHKSAKVEATSLLCRGHYFHNGEILALRRLTGNQIQNQIILHSYNPRPRGSEGRIAASNTGITNLK